MGRLIEADRLKDILEYGILCNVPADAVNTKEEKWNDWVQEIVDKAPTVEAIPKAEVKKFLEEDTKNVSNNVLAIVREDYIHKSDYENRLKADIVAILDKVRNEIDKIYEREGNSFDCLNTLDELKEFIDKIKAERVVEDGNVN